MAATATPTAPAGTTTPPPSAVGVPRRWTWTREEYYRLGELGFFDGKRVELIRGEIVEMSPINWPHANATNHALRALTRALPPQFWLAVQQPFSIPGGPPGTEPQPDLACLSVPMGGLSGHPTGADLLIEVADSSLFYDTTTKAELYATAGVTDYWVVDINARQLHVFRDPEPLPAGLGATAYRTRRVLTDADTVSPLAAPAASVRVADLLP